MSKLLSWLVWVCLALATGAILALAGVNAVEEARVLRNIPDYVDDGNKGNEEPVPHEYTCHTDTECMEECMENCPPDTDCVCTGDPEPEQMVSPSER